MCMDADICQREPTNDFSFPNIPFELKVLGVLKIVGRGWCLDDVYESSGISISTMHTFFHEFTAAFCSKFKDHFIYRWYTKPNNGAFMNA